MALWFHSFSFPSGYAALTCAGFVSVLAHAFVLVLALASGRAVLVLPAAPASPHGTLQWRMLDAMPAPSVPDAALAAAVRPLSVPAVMPSPAERRATPVGARQPAAPRAQMPSSQPRPLRNPQFAAIRIAGFRLPLQLWIGADGRVEALAWGATELPPPLLEALGTAMRQVGFVPAWRDGRPVAAELRLNLCFDDDGVLRASAPECWDPDAVR